MSGTKFVIVPDSHGDMIDPESEQAVYSFIRKFKPEIRIHLGDAFDFRCLRKGASDDDKAESLKEDWEAGERFLRKFFEGGKSNHFLLGNHDFRLYDMLESCSGMARAYALEGVNRLNALAARMKAKTYPYDAATGIMSLGRLRVLHGYHAGASACRQHAAIYGNCVFGHVHTIESAPVPSLEPAEARSIGCLCKRDMSYINKKTGKLRWANGFAYGILFEDGSYQLFQARKIEGRFYTASDIIEL